MRNGALRTAALAACGVVGVLWMVLTVVMLLASFTSVDLLYTANPGGLILPNLSVLGKIYLGASAIMPFITIGAITSA